MMAFNNLAIQWASLHFYMGYPLVAGYGLPLKFRDFTTK